MAGFDYKQAEEIRDALARKFSSRKTRSTVNGSSQRCRRSVSSWPASKLRKCCGERTVVQLKNGPFDLDLILAPGGIERFEDAWRGDVDVRGFPVCSIDDIIESKEVTHRYKYLESLPRMWQFRDWLKKQR